MKVHLVTTTTIGKYAVNNEPGLAAFKPWLAVIKYADWDYPVDILKAFGNADLLGNGSNRVVFDMAATSRRLICHYIFRDSRVLLFVCWLGTHTQYTRLCAERKQFTTWNY